MFLSQAAINLNLTCINTDFSTFALYKTNSKKGHLLKYHFIKTVFSEARNISKSTLDIYYKRVVLFLIFCKLKMEQHSIT